MCQRKEPRNWRTPADSKIRWFAGRPRGLRAVVPPGAPAQARPPFPQIARPRSRAHPGRRGTTSSKSTSTTHRSTAPAGGSRRRPGRAAAGAELRRAGAPLTLVEEVSVPTCISNQVGGPLVGSSRWQGVRLGELLAGAGVRPSAPHPRRQLRRRLQRPASRSPRPGIRAPWWRSPRTVRRCGASTASPVAGRPLLSRLLAPAGLVTHGGGADRVADRSAPQRAPRRAELDRRRRLGGDPRDRGGRGIARRRPPLAAGPPAPAALALGLDPVGAPVGAAALRSPGGALPRCRRRRHRPGLQARRTAAPLRGLWLSPHRDPDRPIFDCRPHAPGPRAQNVMIW